VTQPQPIWASSDWLDMGEQRLSGRRQAVIGRFRKNELSGVAGVGRVTPCVHRVERPWRQPTGH
jgi:hypothetical protein